MAIDLDIWRATGYTVTVDMATLERWNTALPDIHDRLQSLETWETTLDTLIEDLSATASALITNSVGPQLAAVEADIAEAQLAIEGIITGGTALDSARLGNELPAHYLDLGNATGTLARERFALTFSDWVVTNLIGVTSQAAARTAIGAISAGTLADGYAPISHTHPQTDVTGLADTLALKANLAGPNFSDVPKVGGQDIYHKGNLLRALGTDLAAGTATDDVLLTAALLKAAIIAHAPSLIPASVAAGDNVALTLSRQVFLTSSSTHVDVSNGNFPVAFVAVAPGVVRVKLEHRRKDGAINSVAVRVFKNGSQVQEWTTSNSSFQARSVDITVATNDRITFTHSIGSSNGDSEVRNITINTAVAGDATRFIGYAS